MFLKRVLPAILLALATAVAQTSGASGQKSVKTNSSSNGGADVETKKVSRPKSFDLAAMDKTVDPCENFYEYACGNWRKNNPIPGDQARWGRFNELAEYNRQVLHEIVEQDANLKKRTPIQQKVGDMYASCMDEKTVNEKGASPLKPTLDRIVAISNKEQLMETIAYLQTQGVGALFQFGAAPDLHNASLQIANIAQAGLGLPDRDDYLKDDPKTLENRKKYVEHVTKMFTLLGDSPEKAAAEAQTVLAIETQLAQATLERVKMRDPKNRDHKMPVSDLTTLAPNLHLDRFFAATGAPSFTEINVVPPDFFQKVNAAMDSAPLDDWKTYLRWHAVRSAAPLLSEPFVQANFDFYAKTLNGVKELQPRWKRCVELTDRTLGEALGQEYVARTFGPDGKARMLKMVNALEEALGDDIQNLPWMTPDTKKQAAAKLQAISNKIGYPDKWKDYSTVNIVPGDLLGNARRAGAFERKRNLNKIGQPLDKSEWGMTPPTVNAYYNAAQNNINFPAGILQPPFFDKAEDEAVNFGGIGVVIGHELSHGFDDQGSKFDGAGNLSNWWTDADRKEFEQRTGCIADEYSGFVAVEDVHLNGRLTLGENTADNGGAYISMMALHKAMAKDPSIGKTKEGFTPEQRFFLGFAQVWCQNSTPESSRQLAKTDPHSPGQYRTNGTLQNNADFAKAFNCKAGQKMVSTNPCRVW
jgi:putative endopeptidase